MKHYLMLLFSIGLLLSSCTKDTISVSCDNVETSVAAVQTKLLGKWRQTHYYENGILRETTDDIEWEFTLPVNNTNTAPEGIRDIGLVCKTNGAITNYVTSDGIEPIMLVEADFIQLYFFDLSTNRARIDVCDNEFVITGLDGDRLGDGGRFERI